MIDVDKIRPNPFQPRESFPKDEIQQLANTIKTKEIGLLQPISVRKEGDTYRIISGERRWRASQFAGLRQIPAIVKDVTDSELMLQSFIENAHRKDLEPMEKARGLAEVYKLVGQSPTKVADILNNKLKWIPERWKLSDLSKEEERIKEIADMVGLSYDHQYRYLSMLRLTSDEQKRVSELGLGYKKVASISTIEKPEERSKAIELAPEYEEEEVKKISKILKKGAEPLKKAVLEREIEPEIADKLLGVPESKMQKVIEDVKSLRLTPEEAEERAKWAQIEVPKQEQLEDVLKDYDELRREMRERMESPEMKVAGRSFRNLSAHIYVSGALDHMFCPVCGADSRNLVWKCHNVSIKDSTEKLKAITQDKGGARR